MRRAPGEGAGGNVKNDLFRLVKEITGLAAPSISHHLSEKCHGRKIPFPPDEFTRLDNQQMAAQPLLRIFHTHTRTHALFAPSIPLRAALNTYFIISHLLRAARWGRISYQKAPLRLLSLCTCTSSSCVR